MVIFDLITSFKAAAVSSPTLGRAAWTQCSAVQRTIHPNIGSYVALKVLGHDRPAITKRHIDPSTQRTRLIVTLIRYDNIDNILDAARLPARLPDSRRCIDGCHQNKLSPRRRIRTDMYTRGFMPKFSGTAGCAQKIPSPGKYMIAIYLQGPLHSQAAQDCVVNAAANAFAQARVLGPTAQLAAIQCSSLRYGGRLPINANVESGKATFVLAHNDCKCAARYALRAATNRSLRCKNGFSSTQNETTAMTNDAAVATTA